MISGLTLSS